MNCCGQKRQGLEFSSATSLPETETENNLTTIDQRPVYFRYTGNKELLVKGLFDITYTFTVHRRELLIHSEDVSVMRGYDDLKEIREI